MNVLLDFGKLAQLLELPGSPRMYLIGFDPHIVIPEKPR